MTGSMRRLSEIGGRRFPFLRWSVIRMALGLGQLNRQGQVGDGREDALAAYVEGVTAAGDLDAVIEAIDDFAYRRSFLINVGDEKGAILDGAVERAQPRRILELGTYCGYSALRIARAMPGDGTVLSVELSSANAGVARRIWAHAGVTDRVTVVVGSLGDGGKTLDRLEIEHGFEPATVDFVFVDHEKSSYLPDLERILGRGWLHAGSVVMADNVGFPGVPAYRRYMRTHEGRSWHTEEHHAHGEYQSLVRDVMLESIRLTT